MIDNLKSEIKIGQEKINKKRDELEEMHKEIQLTEKNLVKLEEKENDELNLKNDNMQNNINKIKEEVDKLNIELEEKGEELKREENNFKKLER